MRVAVGISIVEAKRSWIRSVLKKKKVISYTVLGN
jgi:hypothetical protein